MASISWGTIKSLLLFFGPLLLPKAISYYRSVRAAQRVQGLPVRSVPPRVSWALALLCLGAAVLLIRALPVFAPENVFVTTQSRLQAPTDVLFARLASLRPLTPADEALRARFVSLESRLLYLRFGPAALAECPFCSGTGANDDKADAARAYLFYAAPALAAPYLACLALVAVATSPLLTGGAREGAAQWRTPATIAAAGLAAADFYLVASYGHQANARAPRLADLDMFFWRARAYRHLALATLLAGLAALIYLSATRRAFGLPPTTAERVEALTRALGGTRSKLAALGVLRNTSARDEELRARAHAYWAREAHLMREAMEERDVVEGVNDALANRVDMRTVERDADAYAQSVLLPLHAMTAAKSAAVAAAAAAAGEGERGGSDAAS